MDGLRKIATAYYEKADTEERKKVIDFFKKLDSNCDREISLEEYKGGGVVDSGLSTDRIFGLLDANSDGKLEFSDVVVLYYMLNKISPHNCDVCGELLVAFFFTCASCFGESNTYDLCVDCYQKVGDCQPHEHPLSDFTDHHAMFSSFNRQKTRELGELRKIANAQYRAAPENIRSLATEFFHKMDKDRDGKIDLEEFLRFMKREGYSDKSSSQFFKMMDRDGSGTLEFDEVVTLYYIIKSGRPFCDMCGNFISGMFFGCSECYNNPNKEGTSSYYLCRDCYFSGKCKHSHKGGRQTQFFDNYLMLEFARYEQQTTTTSTRAQTTPSQTFSSSNAIAPASNTNRDRVGKVFLVQVASGIVSGSIAPAIASSCSIL